MKTLTCNMCHNIINPSVIDLHTDNEVCDRIWLRVKTGRKHTNIMTIELCHTCMYSILEVLNTKIPDKSIEKFFIQKEDVK